MSNDAVGHVISAHGAVRDDRGDTFVHTEQVMGTVVSFRVHPGRSDRDRVQQAVREACESLHAVDATFSTWRSDSAVSRLRRGELALDEAPPEVVEVLGLCARVKEMSGGWFDPWVLPGGVDPTGLVKGWSLDGALRIIREAGVDAALLNAGGDICGFGAPDGDGWRIGIRHPWIADGLACIVRIDAAVATSGSYERGPHLVDPRTRTRTTRTASATVTGPSLAVCDALATALAVGGDEAYELISDLGTYEAYLIRQDGTERVTDALPFA
jgi:thiamine biosynthesis lipoprotein